MNQDSCCLHSASRSGLGFDGNFWDGWENCAPKYSGANNHDKCASSILNYCTDYKLFQNNGTCGIAAIDSQYENEIAAKRAAFCKAQSDSGNYPLECVNWWANFNQSWGRNDTNVTNYCQQLKSNPSSAEYAKYYQPVCGCVISSQMCPQVTDAQCVGGMTGDETNVYKPAYQTAAQISQVCPPVSICNQFSNIDKGSLALGFVQECNQISDGSFTSSWLFYILIFVIILGNIIYVYYMTRKYNR
jgi:hypothetical protein